METVAEGGSAELVQPRTPVLPSAADRRPTDYCSMAYHHRAEQANEISTDCLVCYSAIRTLYQGVSDHHHRGHELL